MVEIVDVEGRAAQGITQPFICLADDGFRYYVKGRGAGYTSLVKEWIVGNLALCFDLPIPPFKILSMPRALFDLDRRVNDLGFGPVFGSRAVVRAEELAIGNLALLKTELKRDIAVFDWWVLNGDRTLSESGGNPNILWSGRLRQIFVIDHNLAFDRSVTLPSLVESHVFGDLLNEIAHSPSLQSSYLPRFARCADALEGIIVDIPDRWRFMDDSCTIETGFSFERARTMIARFANREMWDHE